MNIELISVKYLSRSKLVFGTNKLMDIKNIQLDQLEVGTSRYNSICFRDIVLSKQSEYLLY